MHTRIARRACRALAAPLAMAPFVLQQAVLERGLNFMFRVPVADGELDFLKDRIVALEIPDLGWCWPITLRAGRLHVISSVRRPDTVIRGEAAELAALVRGSVDPDTLFFQRRLCVQGDTELGLALKNFLDGLDPATLPLQPAIRAAAAMRRRFAMHG